jgi:hypothetical protein
MASRILLAGQSRQALGTSENKAHCNLQARSRNAKCVSALSVWGEYAKLRKLKLGTRYIADHHNLIDDAGSAIIKSQRAREYKAKKKSFIPS